MTNTANISTSTGETPNDVDLQTETVKQATTDETSEPATAQPSIDDLQAQVKRLETALSKSNKDAKEHRFKAADLSQKAKELDELKQAIEAEKLSEAEKQTRTQQNLEKQLSLAQSERDTLMQQIRDLKINQSVLSTAGKMNIVDPEIATQLIKSDIELDEGGSPTNVEELLKSLIKAKPYLVAKVTMPTSGGATNPPRSTTTSASQPISWEMIGRLTPADYNAMDPSKRAEISRWMNDPKNHRR